MRADPWKMEIALCDASKVAEDWVVKGCHIHIEGVELQMFPNHRAKPEFRGFFASTPQNKVDEAIRVARNDCLPDAETRTKWIIRLRMARSFMMNRGIGIPSLARGRMFEFKMLEIAIERWEQPR